MWLRHWNLVRDPFARQTDVYVPTPPHAEAVARLVHAIGSGVRLASLRAESGMGKSTVLAKALSEARMPGLRVAKSSAPLDGASLYDQLARSLRLRHNPDASKTQAWRALADAARLIAAQRGRLVLVVDDGHFLADRIDLERLLHLHDGSTVSLIVIERPDGSNDLPDAFAIPLDALTRSESDTYLTAKLGRAGRDGPTFAPKALTRLHAIAEGVPGRIDGLAGLAMRAAAIGVVVSDLPAAAFTEFTQQAAMRKFLFWPAAGDVYELLNEHAGDVVRMISALRAIAVAPDANTAPREPVRVAPTNDERAAVSQQIAALKAGVRAHDDVAPMHMRGRFNGPTGEALETLRASNPLVQGARAYQRTVGK